LLPACAVTLLTGCEANQLYLASHTVVGINAAVNPEQTNGWLIVGYDRSFATVIPRSVETPGGTTRDAQTPAAGDTTRDAQTPTAGGTTRDAMSALACSSLSVKGITIKRYTESIATGEAARRFAAKLAVDTKSGAVDVNAVKDFFDCFKDKPNTDKPATGGG
jgi:hypothetical protein